MAFTGRINVIKGPSLTQAQYEVVMRVAQDRDALKQRSGLSRWEEVIDLGGGLTAQVMLYDYGLQEVRVTNESIFAEAAGFNEEERVAETVDYEIVAVRTKFVESGPTFDRTLVSLAKFVFANETINFVWEQGMLGHDGIRSPQIDFSTNRIYAYSATDFFDSAIPGWFDCNQQTSIRPTTAFYQTPVSTAEGAAGFGVGNPDGYSGAPISDHLAGDWGSLEIIDVGNCSGTTTRDTSVTGPPSQYGFYWYDQDMAHVGTVEVAGKFYSFSLGFKDPINDANPRTEIHEIDDDAETFTLIYTREWTEGYVIGGPHHIQFDSTTADVYLYFDFLNPTVVARYNVLTGEWTDRVLANVLPVGKGLGYDPIERTLIAHIGVPLGGTQFADTTYFLDPLTLETLSTTTALDDVPHHPDAAKTVLGIAPVYGGRYLVVSYLSANQNYTEYGRSVQTSFAVLRADPNSATGYETLELIRRADYDVDHPANIGLDATYSSQELFVNGLEEEYRLPSTTSEVEQ